MNDISQDEDFDIPSEDESEEIKPKRTLRKGNRRLDSEDEMDIS